MKRLRGLERSRLERSPWLGILVLSLSWELALAESPPARVAPPSFPERLEKYMNAGHRDSALALIRAEPFRVSPAVVGWMGARWEQVLHDRPDSASSLIETARRAAQLYAEAASDSFLLRLIHYEERIPSERNQAVGRAWMLYREGVTSLEKFDVPRLGQSLPTLRSAAESADDPYLQMFVHRLTGRTIFIGLGSPAEARAEIEQARALAVRLEDRGGALYDDLNIAQAYMAEDRLAEADRLLESLLPLARDRQDWRLVVGAEKTLAFDAVGRGDLDGAGRRIRDALSAAREHGFPVFEAELLVLSANVLGMLGNPTDAVAEAERAREVARGAGHRPLELAAIIAAVQFLQELERYSQALALLREGLPIAEAVGQTEAFSMLSTQIGETYQHVGRPEDALRHYEAVLPTARRLGMPRFECSVLRSIGLVALDMGDVDAAIRSFESALARVRGLEVRTYQAGAHLDLGRARLARGDTARARTEFEIAHALADTMGNPRLLAEAERGLASVLTVEGNDRDAVALLDRSILRARATGGSLVLREGLLEKARALRRLGDPVGADSLLVECIDLIEMVRGDQVGEEIRLGFLTDKKEVYALRVSLLCELGREDEAFLVAEQARARSLLDLLAGVLPEPDEAIDPELRERERHIAGRLGVLQSELARLAAADAWDKARVDSLEALRLDTARAYRAVREEIAVRDPAYGALTGARPPLRVDDVRERVLEGDQVLLEYLVADAESFVFLVDRDRLKAVRIPVGARQFAEHVEKFRGILRGVATEDSVSTSADVAALPDVARTLHDLLIDPLALDLPEGATLLIVPDGALHYLPFAALHDGARYLVERHPVVYAPSASVLDPLVASRPRRGRASLLAVGNPASYRSEVLLAQARDAARWRFGELPFAGEEARRAVAVFGKGHVLLGSLATEEAVKDAIGGASHVHFATHGVVSEEEPLLSGIVLAQDEDPAEDGLLQTHEILRLRLDADLVTLSACNTGLGRIAGGEGILGLTRAFLHAGARAVVISLWEVPDRASMDLMETFYRGARKDGLPLDRALQQAQIAGIRAGSGVREWAPFALVGTPMGPRERGPMVPAAAWFAALAVLLGVALVARRRRVHNRRQS